MGKRRIFSGIQPSGNLHLGNYLGAIKNWVDIYENYEAIFCVVDLHAITAPQNPKELKKKTLDIAKIYLAAGIDPSKANIFIQSDVPAHCELMWILNTITKTGELFKMAQFKDKAGIKGNFNEKFISIDVGLMNYPILMAADILLYNASTVPVGEDQLQHVELARDLARRFNHRFGETFTVPEALIKKESRRIMGLDDPSKKMSKSAGSKYNRIELLDTVDDIRDKIKKATTDSGRTIEYRENRPALRNLINIFSLISGKKPEEIATDYRELGYKKFKEDLTEAVINFLEPFQQRYGEILDGEARKILEKGAQKARVIADGKIKEVKKRVGLG
jgi:tryptophanyl-tRNA synthetase